MGIRVQTAPIRFGFTLVELLVVVTIILILLTLTATGVKPLLEGREVREGARQVAAYIGSAQALAMARNRPVTVWVERLDNATKPGMALQLYMAEAPAPYTGDLIGAVAVVSGLVPYAYDVGTTGTAAFHPNYSSALAQIVRRDSADVDGDTNVDEVIGTYLIRFNYRGPYYRITRRNGHSIQFQHPTAPSPRSSAAGVPYQIYHYDHRSAMPPLEVPNGVAIDISYSGIGATGQFPVTGNFPILFSFSSGGNVQFVSHDGGVIQPLGAIHLLVGRPEKIGAAAFADSNLADGHNLWVSIGHQTGRITTSEMMINPDLGVARTFARTSQSMGGH